MLGSKGFLDNFLGEKTFIAHQDGKGWLFIKKCLYGLCKRVNVGIQVRFEVDQSFVPSHRVDEVEVVAVLKKLEESSRLNVLIKAQERLEFQIGGVNGEYFRKTLLSGLQLG